MTILLMCKMRHFCIKSNKIRSALFLRQFASKSTFITRRKFTQKLRQFAEKSNIFFFAFSKNKNASFLSKVQQNNICDIFASICVKINNARRRKLTQNLLNSRKSRTDYFLRQVKKQMRQFA